MTRRRIVRSFPGTLILIILLLATCAQSPAPVDETEIRAKVTEYMRVLFPQFQAIEIVSFEDGEGPFKRIMVELQAQGQRQRSEVFLTQEGRYLVLGQIWDLEMEPMRARWQQKLTNAEQKQAVLDFTDRPARGNLDSPVIVTEFSDYQCPYCSRAYYSLEKQIYEEFQDQVKFVFKHLPLESLHPWAKKASEAAACTYVQDKDKFWEMHALLFENQKGITTENLREKVNQFASQLGIDQESFLQCYDNSRTAAMVEADLREAQMLGLNSTPTFMINGAVVQGVVPLDEMRAYIRYALEDAEATAQAEAEEQ